MNGAVALNLVEAVETTGIQLELKGYENTSWDEGSSSNNTSTSRGGRKQFFSTVVPVGPAGNLAPGQYQFNFQFALPDSLPGSFKLRGAGAFAKVEYSLLARIGKSGMFTRDIKHETELVLRPKPPLGIPLQSISNSNSQTINTCCCFSKGSASLTVSLDKNIVQPGGTVEIALEVNNNSTNRFNASIVTLKEAISLREVSGGYNAYQRSLKKHSITGAGIPANSVLAGAGAMKLALTVPLDSNCWVDSHLISCWHVFEVTLKSSSLVSDLKASVPIIIAGKVDFTASTLVAPTDWNPDADKVFDAGTLKVDATDLPSPPTISPGSPLYGGVNADTTNDNA